MAGLRQFERTGVMPAPEDVARVPERWREEIFLLAELLQFQRDGIDETPS